MFGIGKEKDGGFGPPRCFQCGKKCPKSFDCPNRVGRVTSPGRMESPIVVGRVECAMTVDSGALMTRVRAERRILLGKWSP